MIVIRQLLGWWAWKTLRGPEVLRACCLQMSAFIGLQSPRNGLTTIIEEEFNVYSRL